MLLTLFLAFYVHSGEQTIGLFGRSWFKSLYSPIDHRLLGGEFLEGANYSWTCSVNRIGNRKAATPEPHQRGVKVVKSVT